jgi:anti-anti-sigma factor
VPQLNSIAARADALEESLRESHARLVVLDLRDLGFMDSSGVHTIVNASAVARRESRRPVLVRGIPDVVLRIAEEALVP